MQISEKDKPILEIDTSRRFSQWLETMNLSLVISTYQVGKVIFIGLDTNNKISFFERSFPRAMGIGVSADSQSMTLATSNQIYRFNNILTANQSVGRFDAMFAPHQSWITGDLDIHDLCYRENQPPLFVNTLFNCIGTLSEGYSFKPLWKPKFISKYAAEDRCHLNGMATNNGQAKFVTCAAASDVVGGWRDRRLGGGLVIDVESGETVTQGLTMPHSPRLHNGKLWLVNSGTGDLGHIDMNTGKFEPIAFCPGFARGLTLIDNYAIVALSHARNDNSFKDLPLEKNLQDRNADTRCGLLIINIETGDTVESLRFEGVITELFDVSVLQGIRCAGAIGLLGDEINTTIAVDYDLPVAA